MPSESIGLLIDRAIGAVVGAACGDALGWPNELVGRPGMKKQQSQNVFREFNKWTCRSGGRYYPHDEIIEAGNYSDDTQLILCLCRSLHHNEQWWEHFTRIELPYWTLYERGGGGATKRAADAWIDGVKPWSAGRKLDDIRRYFEAGGNGVTMRVLPHVIFNADKESYQSVTRNIMLDGIATHGHPRALVGALAYGYALWKSIRRATRLEFGEIVEDLLGNQSEWANMPEIAPHSEWLSAANEHLPGYQNLWDSTVQEMEALLNICRNELSKGALTIDDDVLRSLQCFDKKIRGAGTVASAAAVFLASRYAPDPMHGLTKAAYAIGADTDTIASMTGGLLGTISGSEWLSDLKNKVQDSEYLVKMVTALIAKEPRVEVSEIIPSSNRSNLKIWMEGLDRKPDDAKITLPDGRQGIVFSGSDYIVRSGKYKVLFRKIACDDGQSLYFTKISKGIFQTEKNKAVSNRIDVVSQKPRALGFGPKLPVQSFEKAVWFYGEIFGLNIKKKSQEVIVFEQGLVLVSSNYTIAQLGEAHLRALIYIEATDIEQRFSLAKENNIEIITPLSPWMNTKRLYFRCSDPDGNIVEVFSSQAS